jgi:hypothetical protein
MTRTGIVIAATLALAATLPAAPARAQSIRTFVSVTGSDTNPCTLAQPCRHFQTAVNATAAGGEVDALDPGAYGSFTIGQAIRIEGQGWAYAAPPSNGAAITIAAGASDSIEIHGVSLNGVGAAGGTKGILFNSGGRLIVRDSVIRNFASNGIDAEAGTSVLIENTIVTDIPFGIGITIIASAGAMIVSVNNVTVNNTSRGFLFSTSSATLEALVSNSRIDNNGYAGIDAYGTNGSIICNVVLTNVTVNQTPRGVHLNAYSAGWFSQVTITRVDGFPYVGGVILEANAAAFSDATNRWPPVIGGTVQAWTVQ